MFLPKTINELSNNNNVNLFDIQFINVAYRPEPVGTPTGGANGVLKVLQQNIGTLYRGFIQRYYYEPKKIDLGKHADIYIKKYKLGTMTKKLIEADLFVQISLANRVPTAFIDNNRQFFFVCHDIGSAVGAYNAGFPYILIYHQQGAFYYERESFGECLNEQEKLIINKYENIAFNNAIRVYFPSKGASDSFKNTTKNNLNFSNFSETPLYNTVPEININEIGKLKLIKKYNLTKYIIDRSKYLIFISIGDYSFNKGLDQIPDLLNFISAHTSKRIMWIACGSKHKSGIFEKIEQHCQKLNSFDYCLIPVREDHDSIMGLLDESDIFIMLQRLAIFDFSTLEAMSLNKKIVLSKIGGNLDFGKENNIIYYDAETDNKSEVTSCILSKKPPKNKFVFDKYFSKNNFINSYCKLYDDIIRKNILKTCSYNICDFTQSDNLRELIFDKDVMIVGAGSSLKYADIDFNNYTVIGMNSALKYLSKIDIHICQDQPPQELLDLYLTKKDVLRLYGIITRPATKILTLDTDLFKSAGINVINYTLSTTVYDPRVDDLNIIRKTKIIYDMYSVLFSALQIVSLLNPKSISLAGVDFSTVNIDGKNPNKYNSHIEENLTYIIRYLSDNKIKINTVITTSSYIHRLIEQYSPDAKVELVEIDDAKDKIYSDTNKCIKKLFNTLKVIFK